MTVSAKDAVPGKIYRLTRDPGTTYYRICDKATITRLERRLSKLVPKLMRPNDFRTWQALLGCREASEVLGVRILRFRDNTGAPRESKSYVSFPPDYLLREVERPPGYGQKKSRGYPQEKGLDSSAAGAETLDTKESSDVG